MKMIYFGVKAILQFIHNRERERERERERMREREKEK